MSGINILTKEYKGWENCISLSNGIVELIATTEVGPRLIYFGFNQGVNELFEMEDQLGTTGGDEWKIYGGHRLWHSPEEKPRTYEPDNFRIDWETQESMLILRQPMEPTTHIRKEMEVSISPDKPQIKILHRLTNEGVWTVELALWALTVMAPGGMEIVPQASRDTGLLPNRMLSLWPYTRLNDPRVYWGEKYITLKQDINAVQPFKFGMPNEHGWAAYINNQHLFVKLFKHVENALYPDFSASSYETYTNDQMLEMETLSPITQLKPGESIEHTEVWHLFDNVKCPGSENEVDNTILPLIRKIQAEL